MFIPDIQLHCGHLRFTNCNAHTLTVRNDYGFCVGYKPYRAKY